MINYDMLFFIVNSQFLVYAVMITVVIIVVIIVMIAVMIIVMIIVILVVSFRPFGIC